MHESFMHVRKLLGNAMTEMMFYVYVMAVPEFWIGIKNSGSGCKPE